MSTATSNSNRPAAPAPIAPPEAQFWEKYSPHHEFPLSSVGSVALHIGGVALFLLALWLLSRMSISDTQPVEIVAWTVDGDGTGEPGSGSGGGDPMPENVNPLERPSEPSRPIPEAEIKKIEEIKEWTPQVPSLEEGLQPQNLDTVRKINQLNENLRKALLEGMSRRKGKGAGEGSGSTGAEGTGSGTKGDPTSSGNRAIRWELNFKTNNGRDYLEQLAAMKATLVIPQPSDWKTNRVYRDLLRSPSGEAFQMDQMPGLYFVDDSADSASRIGRELNLGFSPPFFIAFFPKDIEEELARKEREYRGRKESEIFSTKFKILIRNGQPSITVVDQTPVRR